MIIQQKMAQKPSIPKGTRDFGHAETAERNYIFDTVSRVFRKYGYAQIETPATPSPAPTSLSRWPLRSAKKGCAMISPCRSRATWSSTRTR